MIYLFSLGRTSDLCRQELQALLKIHKIDHKILNEIESHVVVETTNEIDAKRLINQSGGIIKISLLIETVPAQVGIQVFFSREWSRPFPTNFEKYKNFGLSLVGFQADLQDLCEKFKKVIHLHYSLPKSGHELSSAQISGKKFLEIIVVKVDDEYQIFQTIGVQNIDYWTKKDVGRPFIDDRLGMLPLKVARMMINLAYSCVIPAQIGKVNSLDSSLRWNDIAILDPFCGMGSILQEGVDLGIGNIIGSDINQNVLERCEKNVDWFVKRFDVKNVKTSFFVSDAVAISKNIKEKVDLIVTEPFLGDAKRIKILSNTNKYDPILTNTNKNTKDIEGKIPKNPLEIRGNPGIHENSKLEIRKIAKGLTKMYTGILKDWKNVLKEEGVICIIVPEFEVGNQIFKIPFVEICAKVGYNILSENEYSREKAVVKRRIYMLKQQN
jgi:tRNA G10  N-methylase Trm11